MQTNTDKYDVPAHRLNVTFEGKRLGEGKQLGDAKVVSTLFGRAKVRVTHKSSSFNGLWALAILAILGIAVKIWLWQGTPQRAEHSESPWGPDAEQPAAQAPTPVAPPAPAMHRDDASRKTDAQQVIPDSSATRAGGLETTATDLKLATAKRATDKSSPVDKPTAGSNAQSESEGTPANQTGKQPASKHPAGPPPVSQSSPGQPTEPPNKQAPQSVTNESERADATKGTPPQGNNQAPDTSTTSTE